MEQEESVRWEGISLSREELRRNLSFFSRDHCPPPKKKLAEVQLKSVEDLNAIKPSSHPVPLQHQVMLRDRSMQTSTALDQNLPGRSYWQEFRTFISVCARQCAVAVALVAWLVVQIQRDVRTRIEQAQKEMILRREACMKAYHDNECNPEIRIPIAEEFCQSMEVCLSQTSVSSLQIVASLLGETLDSFFTAMSLRTLLTLAGFCLL